MTYEAVTVYNLDGDFLGYGIKKPEVIQLQSVNVWNESPEEIEDLNKQLNRLTQASDILEFWPDVRDPAVVALLDDPNFMPLKTSPVSVVDEGESHFVWFEEPSDENPFGKMNEEASQLVYTFVEAPAPVDVQARVKAACEQVARARMVTA
jgi:hypothetical protein